MPVVTVTYPTARAVASRVEKHFARHLAAARKRGRTDLASAADASVIQTVVDAAFWASLRREEGLTPKISLAFLSPEDAGQALLFASPLPLSPAGIAKLAPAVERPGIHLGVWPMNGELRVWGTTRTLPAFCLVIEVVGSGLLVIKHRAESFGKFVNVAVLEGDQIKIVDEGGANIPDCPGVLKYLLGTDWPTSSSPSINVLVQLAASMRAPGRGGALLVVPTGSTAWRDSIMVPVLYTVDPPFGALADMLTQPHDVESHEWQEDLRRAIDNIAGLTAVDGATLVNDRYELLAFGAKITRRRGNPPVERVLVTEPIEGSAMTEATPVQLGGTRHLSAAQFVHDQRDASALVASQDGRFTIFTWSATENGVHAHRVEALLL
jgi:hypothetical protein